MEEHRHLFWQPPAQKRMNSLNLRLLKLDSGVKMDVMVLQHQHWMLQLLQAACTWGVASRYPPSILRSGKDVWGIVWGWRSLEKTKAVETDRFLHQHEVGTSPVFSNLLMLPSRKSQICLPGEVLDFSPVGGSLEGFRRPRPCLRFLASGSGKNSRPPNENKYAPNIFCQTERHVTHHRVQNVF